MNKYYDLQVEGGEVIVILNSLEIQSLYLVAEAIGGESIDYILVNQLTNTYDSVVVPTLTSNSYMSFNSSSLQIANPSKVLVIRILTQSPTIRLIVENNNYIALMHNKEVNITI
jgi:hypothetical protein